MGKYIKDGRYVYSLNDCRCAVCLYYDSKTRQCKIVECCCLEEKRAALLHFPPDGFERKKSGASCRG